MTTTKMIAFTALLACAASMASAQTKDSFSGTCEELKTQSVPAGDKAEHTFSVVQGTCTVSGEIAGAKTQGGEFAEHIEATAAGTKNWGMHVVTVDGGDKVFVKYQLSAVKKDGKDVITKHTYELTGGTGKMKNAKGSGACTWTGDNYTCTSGAAATAPASATK
jgi:hypothetical protein